MSYGEQHPPDFEQNPYSAPHVNPHATVRAGTIPMPPNQTRGMVNQAVVVGVLMAVQGVLNCVAGVIAAFYAAFMPFMMQEMQQQQAQQAAQNGGNAPPPMPAEPRNLLCHWWNRCCRRLDRDWHPIDLQWNIGRQVPTPNIGDDRASLWVGHTFYLLLFPDIFSVGSVWHGVPIESAGCHGVQPPQPRSLCTRNSEGFFDTPLIPAFVR